MAAKRRPRKPKLPRVPLPKAGGPHRTRRGEPERKRKHRYDPSNPDSPHYDQGMDVMQYP